MKEHLNILLLGSGGRESALADKLSSSPRTHTLYVAPGNGGTSGINVDLPLNDFDSIEAFCQSHLIDMIVVGPEQPLVEGIADHFKDSGIKVIGPQREAAMMEGSKEFAKEFMARHAIPTARFMTVTADTMAEGFNFLESLTPPYVLKADGLAAGKGVLIVDHLADAKDALTDMLEGMFGNASRTVVIEEYLHGVECSMFVATDGDDFILLPAAKDYKRVGAGDTGPNTGGMGAVSPVPFVDDEFKHKVVERIVIPTINGLKAEGIEYRGFIFLGLMNVDGNPMVIEYNVRLGDPETEVILPRLETDLIEILEGIADQTLSLKRIKLSERTAATVMLTAKGYPGPYAKGDVITGLDRACALPVKVFHAGTRRDEHGRILTNGGRVLTVTAFGDDIASAAKNAQEAAACIDFAGKQWRPDIGDDLK